MNDRYYEDFSLYGDGPRTDFQERCWKEAERREDGTMGFDEGDEK